MPRACPTSPWGMWATATSTWATRSTRPSPKNAKPLARALSMEGTCTGEHGIGLHKQGFLIDEAGEDAVRLMRSIKQALDPLNILNPGKISQV